MKNTQNPDNIIRDENGNWNEEKINNLTLDQKEDLVIYYIHNKKPFPKSLVAELSQDFFTMLSGLGYYYRYFSNNIRLLGNSSHRNIPGILLG